MHELSLAENVISIVENTARKAGARRVKKIRLALGVMAHVDPDTLLYCCELVSREGLSAEAEYEVERCAAVARCEDCLQEVSITAIGQACPACGSLRVTVSGGDEMQVLDIVIE